MYYRGDDYGEFVAQQGNEGAQWQQGNIWQQEFGATGSGLPSARLVATIFGLGALGSLLDDEKVTRAEKTAEEVLRATTEGITTVATTIGPGETSLPSSPPLAISTQNPPPPSVVLYPNLGQSGARKKSVLASQLRPAPARRSSRASRASPRLSRAQQKALSREVQALLRQ